MKAVTNHTRNCVVKIDAKGQPVTILDCTAQWLWQRAVTGEDQGKRLTENEKATCYRLLLHLTNMRLGIASFSGIDKRPDRQVIEFFNEMAPEDIATFKRWLHIPG